MHKRQIRYHLTRKSENAKTGSIAVTTTSRNSCPDDCPMKNACYASSGGPLALHWRAVSEGSRGCSLDELTAQLRTLPTGSMLRHNAAGDLPSDGSIIDGEALMSIALSTAHLGPHWTYTHHVPTPYHIALLRRAQRLGFVTNLSANGAHEVDELSIHGLPVVTTLPSDGRTQQTPKGRRIVQCPATVPGSSITCKTCGHGSPLCSRADRGYAIGFPAHGARKKLASDIAAG